MSSIVQTLNLRGVKNPEKVDAVGLQPTASIPFLQYGDPAGIRTPDPLLKRQLLCRLSYRVKTLWPPPGRREKWLGRLDSNQRMRESKSLALPLGYAPMWKENRGPGQPRSPVFVWGGRWDSNPRHPEPQSGALTN